MLTVLWRWFVMPQFGLAPLGVNSAIGISLVVEYLTHQVGVKDDGYEAVERVVAQAVMPLMALGIAWIVVLFR